MEFSDNEHLEFLQQALDDMSIDEVAHGIALQAHDRGIDSLSKKQLFIYNNNVVPVIKRLAEKRETENRIARWPK